MPKPVKRRQPPDSDSFSSFFISWEKNRAPPIYPNAQTGPVTTLSEFLLFYASVLLLVLGLGLSGFSIWSLFFKSHYTFLVDCSTELGYFALPAAILCLPCFWIVLGIHNCEKTHKYLSLVLIILTISSVLGGTGVYLGFTHKLYLNPKETEGNPVLEEFRRSLGVFMSANGRVWDEVQDRFGCCGVDNYTDWFVAGERLPKSCCDAQERCDNSTAKSGCLGIIAATVTAHTCLFAGINCIALFLQCCVFVIITVIYIWGKSGNNE